VLLNPEALHQALQQLTLAQLSFQLDWLEIRLLAAQDKTQAAIARLEPLYFQSQAQSPLNVIRNLHKRYFWLFQNKP